MDQATTDFFEANFERLCGTATSLFDVDRGSVKRLGSFESAVYDVTVDTKPYILRATDSDHRTVDQIRAELHWVDYLATNGVPLSRPIRSINGSFVEPLSSPDSERTIALLLFEKADGARIKPEQCNDQLIQRWGSNLGMMHRLTVGYEPGEFRRHEWHSDYDLIPPDSIIENEPLVAGRVGELVDKIKNYPTNGSNYGLIHSDLHQGNFFVEDGRMTIFDTDDCHYDFFLHDLAMPLFYTYHDHNLVNYSGQSATAFWKKLIKGYEMEFPIDRSELSRLADFLKLREMLLYMIITKENIADADPWCRRFMKGRKERIENRTPVIDLDLETL